jgi:hypothetical protein
MTSTPTRTVKPLRWTMLGTAAATSLALGQIATVATITATPAFAQSAAEAGEAGEAGAIDTEGAALHLTALGLFEAAHRIVAALYAQGEVTLAQEHLADSHHAYYEDLAHGIEEYGGAAFEAETLAFAEAVNSAAAPEVVAAAAEAVLAAIAAADAASGASDYERGLSIKDLLTVARADYDGGVYEGKVDAAQEYRDAWGFVETARARANALAASTNEASAKAGTAILEQIEALAPLFPSLTATEAGGDPELLPSAAAWTEIIALRIK